MCFSNLLIFSYVFLKGWDVSWMLIPWSILFGTNIGSYWFIRFVWHNLFVKTTVNVWTQEFEEIILPYIRRHIHYIENLNMAAWLTSGNNSLQDHNCLTILGKKQQLCWEWHGHFFYILCQAFKILNNCLTRIGNT